MIKSLIIVAHGSRVQESNDEVRALAEAVALDLKSQFSMVTYAFLEIASPLLGEVIEQCAMQGAVQLVVLPYFLAPGRHIQNDIPNIIDEKCKKYPALNIQILPYIGKDKMMKNLICDIILHNSRIR